MKAQFRFRIVRCAVLAVLALAPVSLLAQQGEAAGEQNQSPPPQTATLAPQAEEVRGPAGQVQISGQVDEPDGTEQPDNTEQTEGSEAAEQADEPQNPADTGPRTISGMSILGNQEAPTSLVIVPWRSSEIGDSVGVSTVLDDARQPVDREVFMRALRYYEIRSESRP